MSLWRYELYTKVSKLISDSFHNEFGRLWGIQWLLSKVYKTKKCSSCFYDRSWLYYFCFVNFLFLFLGSLPNSLLNGPFFSLLTDCYYKIKYENQLAVVPAVSDAVSEGLDISDWETGGLNTGGVTRPEVSSAWSYREVQVLFWDGVHVLAVLHVFPLLSLLHLILLSTVWNCQVNFKHLRVNFPVRGSGWWCWGASLSRTFQWIPSIIDSRLRGKSFTKFMKFFINPAMFSLLPQVNKSCHWNILTRTLQRCLKQNWKLN